MSEKVFDIAVVGAGIVGAATAFKLRQAYPDFRILVLEKEAGPATHQTGRNSGVIHSGIYYKPGSYKASTCINGREQLYAFAQEHGIAHDACGKIIVATEPDELPRLERIMERGKENGLDGLRRLDSKEIGEVEPHVKGLQAIWVPQTGIIDYTGTTKKLLELALQGKGELHYHAKLLRTVDQAGGVRLFTSKGSFYARKVMYCAGLQSDRLAERDGVDLNMKIVGFRGDYYQLSPAATSKVKNLIYPVPDPDFPFLGVHFTRMVDGSVECGPNAVFSFKREGYSRTAFSFTDSWDALTYGGTWKLFFRHWRQGMDEYRRAFSKQLFLKALQRMIPDLEMEDLEPAKAGVRAQALGEAGNLVDDFAFGYSSRAIHVLNAPSPAATASLAIADVIVAQAQEHIQLGSS